MTIFSPLVPWLLWGSLLLLIIASVHAASSCEQVSNCVECLEETNNLGCVWTAGQCLTDCDIADAACFSTTTETLANEGAWAACRDAGEVSCREEPYRADCLTCLEGSDLQCAWTAGECRGDCDIADAACYRNCDAVADAACYSPETFPDLVVPDICATALDGVTGVSDSCTGRYTTCSDCLNNREGNCAWIGGQDEGNGCHPSCDSVPDFTCYSPEVISDMSTADICGLAGEAPPCNAHFTCNDCLEGQCAWIGGDGDGCFPSCDDNPDFTCYSPEVLSDMDNTAVCQLAGAGNDPDPGEPQVEAFDAEDEAASPSEEAAPTPAPDSSSSSAVKSVSGVAFLLLVSVHYIAMI